MQVIGPMNQRTAESFPIAGELYGWCATRHRRATSPRARSAAASSTPRPAATSRRSPPATSSTSTSAPVSTPPIAAIGNIVALFAAHPDQLELVRKNPAARAGRLQRGAPLLGARSTPGAGGDQGRRDRRRRRSRRAPRWRSCSAPATATRATTTTPTPSWSSATRSTTSPSATAPHGCAGQGLARLEAHADHRRAGPPGRAARRRAPRSGSRATSPAASRSSRSWRWCRHEDRARPSPLRGSRPVRGGRARR